MIRIVACALVALFFPLAAFPGDIIIFDASKNLGNPKCDDIVKHDDSIEINSKNKINFNGNWDLRKNLDFEIEAENLSSECGIDIVLFLFDDYNKEIDPKVPFISARLNPGESKTVTISFPSPCRYKSIAEKMKLMRADPFGNSNRYNNPKDLSKIKTISVYSAWTSPEPHFKIKKIVAKDTSNRKDPVWYSFDEEKFFPFIDKYGQFKFKDWPGKIHSDVDIKVALKTEEEDLRAHPSPKGVNKYGGWEKGPKSEATGHFYVKKIDGKWWFVDPTGALFWSHGVVRVTPSSGITPLDGREFYFEDLPAEGSEFALFYKTEDKLLTPYYVKRGIKKTYDFSAANIYRKYGAEWRDKYAESSHRRLRSWGLNTIANSSDESIFMMRRTPYIDRFELKPPEVPTLVGAQGLWWPFPDVFSKEFEQSIEKNLLSRKEQLNDPWCLGFFVDNEIHWGSPTTLAQNTLLSPAESACKKTFSERLKAKYGNISSLNTAWGTSYSNWNDFLAFFQNASA